MPPKKKLNKDKLVPIRMDERLKKLAEAAARKQDVSLSHYVRTLIKKDLSES